MIKVLQGGSQKVQTNAAAALMGLAASPQMQDVIRVEGGIQALIMVFKGTRGGRGTPRTATTPWPWPRKTKENHKQNTGKNAGNQEKHSSS